MKLVACHDSFIPFFLPNLMCIFYLAVKGCRSGKGIKSSVGSFSRASVAALSAASFARIPRCPRKRRRDKERERGTVAKRGESERERERERDRQTDRQIDRQTDR